MRSSQDKALVNFNTNFHDVLPILNLKKSESHDKTKKSLHLLSENVIKRVPSSVNTAKNSSKKNPRYLIEDEHKKNTDKILNQILKLYSERIHKTVESENLNLNLAARVQSSYSLSCTPAPSLKKKEQTQQFDLRKTYLWNNNLNIPNPGASRKRVGKRKSASIIDCLKIGKIEKNSTHPYKSPMNFRICEIGKKSMLSHHKTQEIMTSTPYSEECII